LSFWRVKTQFSMDFPQENALPGAVIYVLDKGAPLRTPVP
jgi:hypothetical protein